MTYSTEQQAYLAARAAYEQVEQSITTLMDEAYGLPETDEGIEAYCIAEEALRMSLNAYAIWETLKASENALIAWGHEQAKTVKEYRMYRGMMEEMFGKINKFPVYRTKLIALIMKLDASKKTGKAA